MADSIYDHERYAALLRPLRLLPVHEILADRGLLPDVGGVYAWWFSGIVPGVPLEGTRRCGDHHLLYIGIAPREPNSAGASSSTLRKRVRGNHLGSRLQSSTLRRSLAAHLEGELAFDVFRNARKKAAMSKDDERCLTRWLAANAALSFLVDAEPWRIEKVLLARGDPIFPLNSQGAKHAFVPELRKLRARLGLAKVAASLAVV